MRKLPTNKLLLLTCILLSFIFSIQAQDEIEEECITEHTVSDMIQFNRARAEMKRAKMEGARFFEDMVLIPVTHHICRTSAGTGGVSVQELEDAMDRVNGIYEEFGMSFYTCGNIVYHNNDLLYNYDRNNGSNTAISGLDVANTYNIYWSNNVSGACGFAYFPGNSPDRTVLSNGCIVNGTTLEHEIGHSFYLPHTHQGGNERVARPGEGNYNCDDAGDGFCDTEADPTLSGKTQSDATCEVSGLGNGIDGLAYRTDGKNIMSYAPRKNCRTVFSEEQKEMMYWTAATHWDRIKFTCPDNPKVNFDAVSTVSCAGGAVLFEDLSYGDKSFTWNWSFTGGFPNSSNMENPEIVYANTGTYPVTLTVTNSKGSGTETKNAFIKVVNPINLPYTQDFEGSNVIDNLDVRSYDESRVFVNTAGGRSGNGLVLTGNQADIYYTKAYDELAFANNPAFTASATLPCIDATDYEDLELSFDMNMLFGYYQFYTTFRLLVNGEQIGDVYQPFSDTDEGWENITVDLTPYVGGEIYITFEANSKYNNTNGGNSNGVYIDNINITGTATNNLSPFITAGGATNFCEGDNVLLTASPGPDAGPNVSYQWYLNDQMIQNGNQEMLAATESGSYTVMANDGTNSGTSDALIINVIAAADAPQTIDVSRCENGEATLSVANPSGTVKWFDQANGGNELGEDDLTVMVSTSTTYYAEQSVTDTAYMCPGDRSALSVTIKSNPTEPLGFDAQACAPGEEVVLTAQGSGNNIIKWYDAPSGTRLETGDSYTTTISDDLTVYVQQEEPTISMSAGATDNSMGTGGMHAGGFYLTMDVSKAFRLESATVYAEVAKERTFELLDVNDNVIESITINVPSGESIIDLNFDVPVGDELKIGAADGADLFRNNSGSNYPYEVADIVSITGSTAGADFYYYLYDWKIIPEQTVCKSDFVAVNATIETCTGLENSNASETLNVYPNPTSGIIHIGNHEEIGAWKISDINNRIVKTGNNAVNELNLGDLAVGIYYLQTNNKVVKIVLE